MLLRIIQASKIIRPPSGGRTVFTSTRIFRAAGKEGNDGPNSTDTSNFKTEAIPNSALYLGFGGAIPFTSLTVASFLTTDYTSLISTAQVGYAACILTFLGGVHWGREISNPTPSMKMLTISILPSLYAWTAFALPHHYALYYLSAGLVGAGVYDINNAQLPGWYRKLRIPLTVLAASSVFITGFNVAPCLPT